VDACGENQDRDKERKVPKLTKEFVDQAPPGRYADSDLHGFELFVGESGVRTFSVRYRPRGAGQKGRRPCVKLGRFGVLTVAEARDAAKRLLGRVAAGEDPAAALREAKSAITVGELAERFLTDEVLPKRSRGTFTLYSIYLRKHTLPEIGEFKAETVSRTVVARLHLKIGRGHRVTANRVLATLSGLFAFGVARGLLSASFINPAKNVEKFKETARERFLSSQEFERLGLALREAETVGVPWEVDESGPNAKHAPKPERRITVVSPFATAAIRLLIFTGCRLREILHLEWRSVDFERGLLNLPTSKTGRKSVVLGAPALDILAALPRLGAYVIASDDPSRPRSDLKRPWDVVCRRAGLEGLRLHDLRHSFASVGAGAGLGLPVIGKLLGHASPATTARYAHLDADPVRKAANAIGATIAAAMDGRNAGENVVRLGKARGDG
jgi:integrase